MATGDPPLWNGLPLQTDPNCPPGYMYTMTTNQTNSAAWTSQPTWPWPPARRGQPRHIALVWLEREDEPIPPPWTDCVIHRFFDHATATFGVIVESDAIPWMIQPGNHVVDHVSWEALDIAIRQYTLDQVAQTLPHLEPQTDGEFSGLGDLTGQITIHR